MSELITDIIIKKGTDAARQNYTPAEGELIFTTDTKQVYVGDGSTQGGVLVTDAGLVQRVASLETLTGSDDMSLDSIQEIVDYIKQNREDLENAAPDWSVVQNKPNFQDAALTSITTIQAGVTKANVGLSNVEDLSSDQILAKVTQVSGGTF